MSLYLHYLDTATSLISSYEVDTPFHLYLKQFFSKQRKYGSRDRRQISSLCYSFFRLGNMLSQLSFRERVLAGAFIGANQNSKFLESIRPGLAEQIHLPVSDKIRLLGGALNDIFPFSSLFSPGIGVDDYCASMLKQPDFFVRLRPKHIKSVVEKLESLSIPFSNENVTALRLKNGIDLEKDFRFNHELVVQDLNSQKVGAVIRDVFAAKDFQPKQVWDCCAASGGKSIMMYDFFPGISITASDIRDSILRNFAIRLRNAGVPVKHQFVADLSTPGRLPILPMPFIITDVPCTGSGTWARTPEQLFFFDNAIVAEYAERQKKIVTNVLPYLQKNGMMAYITCSVFRQENEEIVSDLASKGMKVLHTELLNGTAQKADSMFVAILQKNG